jgi:hypothetical protein
MHRVALALGLALGLAGAAEAQRPQTRQGFWIGFGLGAGSAGADCSVCTDEREIGLSGHLRAGATVSPAFLLGAETNGWVKSEGGVDQRIGALSATAYWYPSVAGGFYLKGGLGVMGYWVDDGFDELSAVGLGLQLGLGYDFRVGSNFSLTPYLNALAAGGADAKFNGIALGEDFNPNLVQFGMAVSWH